MTTSASTLTFLRNSYLLDGHDHSDIYTLPDPISIGDKARQVYVLPFETGRTIDARATTFENAFDRANPDHVISEALLQLFFEAANRFETRSMHNKEWMSYSAVPRRQMLEEVMGINPIDPAEEQRSRFLSDPNERLFLRGVANATPVIEHRVWFHLYTDAAQIDFADLLQECIVDAHKAHDKWLTQMKKAVDDVEMSSFQGRASEGRKYVDTLSDMDRWKLIYDLDNYAHAVDLLLNVDRLLTHERNERHRNDPLYFSKGPLHPRHTLTPKFYLERMHDPRIDPCQTKLDQYERGPVWVFPKPDRVVVLNRQNHHFMQFRAKFFPAYQVRFQIDRSRIGLEAQHKTHRLLVETRPQRGSRDHEVDETLANSMAFLGMADDEAGDEAVNAFVDASAANQDGVEIVPDQNGNISAYKSLYLAQQGIETRRMNEAIAAGVDHPSRSAFHAVRVQGLELTQMLITDYEKGMSEDYLRTAYLEKQALQFSAYEDRCMRSSSDVSSVGKIINEWYEDRVRNGLDFVGGNHPHVYANLSTFGNMYTRWLNRLESAKFISSTHQIILHILLSSRGVFKHKFNQMLSNYCLHGPAESGKSKVLVTVADMSIPNTVEVGMDMTGNADKIDYDRNDIIRYTEEVNLAMMTTESKDGGNKQLVDEHKERLTSQMAYKRVFVKRPDGSRDERRVASQQIQVWLFCTNHPISRFDPNLMTRYWIEHIPLRERRLRPLTSLANIEEDLTLDGIQRQRETEEMFHILEFHQYHIQKCIAIGALTPVNLTALRTILPIFTEYLHDHFFIPTRKRNRRRIENFAEQLVIALAIEYVFCSPDSPHFGKPFHISMYADIDPLLHDSTEIAHFAITSSRSQFIPPERDIVLEAIRTLYLDRKVSRDNLDSHSKHFMVPSTPINSTTGLHIHMDRSRLGDRSSFFGANGTNAVTETAENKYPKWCHSYLRIDSEYTAFTSTITAYLQEQRDHLTKDTVNDVMKLLKGTVLNHPHKYVWDPLTQMPKRTPGTQNEGAQALLRGVGQLFFHLDLFDLETDPIAEALRHTYHTFDTDEKTYLDSTEVDPEYPYLLNVRQIAPRMGRQIDIIEYARQITKPMIDGFASSTSTLKRSPEHLVETNGVSRLTKSYDELSRLERCQRLFLPAKEADVKTGRTSFERLDARAREFDLQTGERVNCVPNMKQYPFDLIPTASLRKKSIDCHIRRNQVHPLPHEMDDPETDAVEEMRARRAKYTTYVDRTIYGH